MLIFVIDVCEIKCSASEVACTVTVFSCCLAGLVFKTYLLEIRPGLPEANLWDL